MKVLNIGNKVIGIRDVVVLPNETADVADSASKTVAVYERLGLVKVLDRGVPAAVEETHEKESDTDKEAEIETDPEELKKERLEKLDSMSEEEVCAIAVEYGINPADCKDQKDVVKKVKAALKK